MSDNIKITIKSSGDTKYEVDVSPSITVLELKNEIATKSSIPADRQRLIYSGKVLKDTETVSFYKIQLGHTVHLVKSAGGAKATPPATAPQASSASDGAASTTTAATSGVPSNIAAGQGAFNPLADLTGARYAGYTQLPSASMFGPDGGMNAMPDPEQMQQMMSNPMFQESMNSMLSNPQMLDYLINQSPQLRAMGPQAREILQSPFFRQMISNPEAMRSMMSMGAQGGFPGFGGAGGAGGANAFPAPGANPTVELGNSETANSDASAPAAGTGAGAGAGANPFASLFPGGVPPVDPFSLFGGAGAAPQESDNRPPEERYESQLRQLNDMGFFDFDQNVAALRRTGGSVQGAIEYLLSNP